MPDKKKGRAWNTTRRYSEVPLHGLERGDGGHNALEKEDRADWKAKPSYYKVDPIGMSEEEQARVQKAISDLREEDPELFSANEEVIIGTTPDLQQWAVTKAAPTGGLQVVLAPDALDSEEKLKTIIGHELVHARLLNDMINPQTERDRIYHELRGYLWEIENRGFTGARGSFGAKPHKKYKRLYQEAQRYYPDVISGMPYPRR